MWLWEYFICHNSAVDSKVLDHARAVVNRDMVPWVTARALIVLCRHCDDDECRNTCIQLLGHNTATIVQRAVVVAAHYGQPSTTDQVHAQAIKINPTLRYLVEYLRGHDTDIRRFVHREREPASPRREVHAARTSGAGLVQGKAARFSLFRTDYDYD
jgi:hypothetical protein